MYNHVRLLALLRGAKHIYNDVRLFFELSDAHFQASF